MKRILLAIIALAVCAGLVKGQKGTAESDYYPMNFKGETWTGEVTETNDATREITLTYKKKDKTQTFVGVLDNGYQVKMKDGSVIELKVSQLALGTRIKVYYITKEDKASGTNVTVHKIFKIRFLPPESK